MLKPDAAPLAQPSKKRVEEDPAMARLNDQIRERLREELSKKGWSQRDAADMLGWSQSYVAKRLDGRVEFSVNDLDGFCTILQLRPSEIVRDRGREFSREMTPFDLWLLDALEKNPRLKEAIEGIITVALRGSPHGAAPGRRKPTIKASLARSGAK
jgi:transcriptional regulator with XRE-family HTH domain